MLPFDITIVARRLRNHTFVRPEQLGQIEQLIAEPAAGHISQAGARQRVRMISELRDRRIDGSRADILATLTPLFEQGVVSAQDWRRLTRQLGLA